MGVRLDGEPAVSLDALRRHKESVVAGMVSAHEKMFTESGMDFILGTARFVAPRTVEIRTRNGGTRRIRGDDVVINTGTPPAVPDLPGIREADVWTSETILQLNRLPMRLSILGGGTSAASSLHVCALRHPGDPRPGSGSATAPRGS
jgi:pyruvate/2-oxoglutarate dehydrogenase complex dihydrolipoamide dehydrogenase (E3) component